MFIAKLLLHLIKVPLGTKYKNINIKQLKPFHVSEIIGLHPEHELPKTYEIIMLGAY